MKNVEQKMKKGWDGHLYSVFARMPQIKNPPLPLPPA
jgi:hypothetical protein